MINENKTIVIDLDGCICPVKKENEKYSNLIPNFDIVEKLKQYRKNGFYIIIYTSRNMRTYQGNIGKINVNTLKVIFNWLDKHDIPYDEIHIGKPWCGNGGFYIDDKSIRPKEFLGKSYDEICKLIGE